MNGISVGGASCRSTPAGVSDDRSPPCYAALGPNTVHLVLRRWRTGRPGCRLDTLESESPGGPEGTPTAPRAGTRRWEPLSEQNWARRDGTPRGRFRTATRGRQLVALRQAGGQAQWGMDLFASWRLGVRMFDDWGGGSVTQRRQDAERARANGKGAEMGRWGNTVHLAVRRWGAGLAHNAGNR